MVMVVEGDVDMDDFGSLRRCMPDESSPGVCEMANIDKDPQCRPNEADVSEFNKGFTGPGVPLGGNGAARLAI
jgi:hypothetical protein